MKKSLVCARRSFCAAGIFFAFLFVAAPVSSQVDILDFYSPLFLAGGASAASPASPEADVLNPAASGGQQRLTLEAGYMGLADLGTTAGFGSSAELGISIPTRAGVFTASGHFLSALLPSLSPGTLGAANISFAKDLWPGLYFGAGLGFQFGSDWGLGLDLGVVGAPGSVGFLKDFRWGLAVRGIGRAYMSAAGVGVPPAFTPDIGVEFFPVKTDVFALSLLSSLSFPSLADVRFVLGGSISFAGVVFLDASYSFDLNDAIAGTSRPIPVSGGLRVKLPTGAKALLKGGDVTVASAAAPLKEGVLAAGLAANISVGRIDTIPPVIILGSTEPAYISPGTASDQKELSVSAVITDDRYVKGYRLVVKNAAGTAVRTIQAVDKGPSSKGLRNLWDRLVAVKQSIPIPSAIAWDGKDDLGIQVPDGSYTYTLEAWDDNNNTARTDPLQVVVDTTPPRAGVSASYLEFSPSGEGTKGTLPIAQDGSVEDLWVGAFLDSTGAAVRQYRWAAGSPRSFAWDGKDSYGRLVPDGVYGYLISSTDKAGNTGSARIEGIVVNTKATPVSLSTDLPAFSPNGDGIKDVIRFIPDVKVSEGIDTWSLAVRNQAGEAKRTFSGKASVPSNVPFDGKDDSGTPLPEGNYRGSLTVVYGNGHTPTAESPIFLLRVTPPQAVVSASYLEFSPDGVGKQTLLSVTQSGSTETLWQGSIRNAAGAVVRRFAWEESPPPSFSWDGRDNSGRLVPDGAYTYTLTSTDPAGNTGGAELAGIVVNTASTPANLSIESAAFSPNGDGVQDTLTLAVSAPVSRGLQAWTVVVKDPKGAARRSFSGKGPAPATLDFDGRDDSGTLLPEGVYHASLSLTYANGHEPSADSPPFVLDVTAPSAKAAADYTVFSPAGTGTRSTLTFTQSATKDARWTGTVQNAAGKEVRTAAWSPRPAQSFVFDGHADDGSLLPDGAYTYVLAGRDAAGNSFTTAPLPFQIDTRETPVILSTDLTAFSPNGDGVKDSLRIIPSLKVSTDVDTFTLSILNAQDGVVRHVSGKGTSPVTFVWNGLDDAGIKAPDGSYTAALDVLYRNGNHPVARTAAFVLDTAAPTIKVASDSLWFCPTPDSKLHAVAISQSGSAEDQWDGRVVDSAGRMVRTYAWKGSPPAFSWDGRDDRGNTVADGMYAYTASSTDAAGNTGSATLKGIRVDTRPAPVSLVAASDGLSPNGDGVRDTIGFSLSVGLTEGIASWTLTMASEAGVQKTTRGSFPVPDTIVWDGKTDGGEPAPEGIYTARLEVDYVKGNAPVAESAPFLLSVTPPAVKLFAGPLPFSPDGDGYNDTLNISMSVSSKSPVDTWNVTVLDPMDHYFFDWSGKGAPTRPIAWDGFSAYGELVQAADNYTLVATVRDALGNVAAVRQIVPIDVLVMREGDKLRIRISSITFKANTPDYTDVPQDRLDLNMKTISRLAEIFTRYSQYKIRIEGYAVMVYWDDPARGKLEQQDELIPLSKERAEAVKSALVKQGIAAERITTEGLGGVNPVAPFGDLENRWKDRRVEFLLVR